MEMTIPIETFDPDLPLEIVQLDAGLKTAKFRELLLIPDRHQFYAKLTKLSGSSELQVDPKSVTFSCTSSLRSPIFEKDTLRTKYYK